MIGTQEDYCDCNKSYQNHKDFNQLLRLFFQATKKLRSNKGVKKYIIEVYSFLLYTDSLSLKNHKFNTATTAEPP
jgi:hypothetical protein